MKKRIAIWEIDHGTDLDDSQMRLKALVSLNDPRSARWGLHKGNSLGRRCIEWPEPDDNFRQMRFRVGALPGSPVLNTHMQCNGIFLSCRRIANGQTGDKDKDRAVQSKHRVRCLLKDIPGTHGYYICSVCAAVQGIGLKVFVFQRKNDIGFGLVQEIHHRILVPGEWRRIIIGLISTKLPQLSGERVVLPECPIELQFRCRLIFKLRPSSDRFEPVYLGCRIQKTSCPERTLSDSAAQPTGCAAPIELSRKFKVATYGQGEIHGSCPTVDIPSKSETLTGVVAASSKGNGF